MKKALKILATTILGIFVLMMNLIGSAAILPVENVWILDHDCIIILRENGDLLFANSIDSQNSTVISKGVSDFYGSGDLKGIILYNNGDVAMISNGGYNKERPFELEIVAKNAKAIYSLPDFEYAYVDNDHVLRGKHRSANTEGVAIMTNVNRCYNKTNYVIKNDNTLCSFDVISNTTTEILTNVKDVKNNAVLRKNGDLYIIKGDNPPERIGQNVNDINDIVTNVNGFFYHVDSNNNLYKDGRLVKSDVLKIFYVMEGYGQLFYVTKDNELYSLDRWDKEYFIEDNVESILGETQYFFKGTDGNLYNKQGYKKGYSGLYLENIADVIKFDRLGDEDDKYLFITNSGELYGAFGESWKNPFLTSFCQKNTQVIINDKNVELTAKIQTVNERSMYPFRECLENMGATVLWDGINQIAIGEYNGVTIEFPIGKSEYWINGIKHSMDVPSYIDESVGRTYIPIRYAAEGLGFTVDWIEGKTENIISIHN